MGMFDDVQCDYPLPDGWHGKGMQSKDFECEMTLYRITAEGRLTRQDSDWEDVPKAERPYPDAAEDDWKRNIGARRRINIRWPDTNYHGIFNFYGGGFQNDWHEYNAKFTDGQLVEIVPVIDPAEGG